MKKIINPIIPVKQYYLNINNSQIIEWNNVKNSSLDYKAIASFCSLGFMLDNDTFYENIKTLSPYTEYKINNENKIISDKAYWDWHYSPKDASFDYFLKEFSNNFNEFIFKKVLGKKIILPLSGGLDSRTLLVPIRKRKNVILCSYEFENGISEITTAKKLAAIYKLPLYTKIIQKGYLWNKIDEIYQLNKCFTDFTHPRQIDALDEWRGLGDVVLLGHWGDVLFDRQSDSRNKCYDKQLVDLRNKILKPSGVELAEDLWSFWGMSGTYISFITERLDFLYSSINIDDPSAKFRAFKSKYWAPKWTSINSSMFNALGEAIYPYYSNKMCKFICTIPESYLSDRKIQIEYIKQNSSSIASIPWQKVHPLNLNNYQLFNTPQYYIIRILRKIKRLFYQVYSNDPKLITRNWELQFLGDSNLLQLEYFLLKHKNFKIIPKYIIVKYLVKFKKNPVKYAHSICMILTLIIFSDKHYKK